MKPHLPFPALRTYHVNPRMPLLTVSLLAAALVFPISRWAAAGVAVLAMIIAWPMAAVEWRNSRLRSRWAKSFEKRLPPWEVAAFVRHCQEPCRICTREYSGFGMNRVRPATYLEVGAGGENMVIWPNPKDPYRLAATAQLEVRHE